MLHSCYIYVQVVSGHLKAILVCYKVKLVMKGVMIVIYGSHLLPHLNFETPTRNTISVTQESNTKKSVLKDLKVGRQSLLTPKARHLYGRVIDSSKKLAQLSRKLSSYQEKLRAAKKLSDSPNFYFITNSFTTTCCKTFHN
ncbi:hypothetical protein JTB14_024132 [Gonioctena quinquepunctata]|nr:hypothetical protein JTB14_024132 [Gonioctena quinquepunctata]